jgi:ketosteroid isomerase-like protein
MGPPNSKNMSNPIEIVKSFYAALDRGDISSALATLHDELEWTEAERAPYYTGTWHSPEDVYQKLFAPLLRDWEGFSVTPHDFIASGERVVSLGAYSGTFKATGKAMTAPFAHAWIVRGDRISRFTQYTDTIKIREAMS